MLIVSDAMLVPIPAALDVGSVPSLKRHLKKLEAAGVKQVFLDLARTTYIDSSGMSLILSTLRRMKQHGGILTLVNVSPEIMYKLKIACVVDLLPTIPAPKKKEEIPALPKGALPKQKILVQVRQNNLEQVRVQLMQFFDQTTLTYEQKQDLLLAAGEAMGNFVLHTPTKRGFLAAELFSDRLNMEAVDEGPGYEIADDEVPVTTLEHGRGIKIMRLLTDSVTIRKKAHGKGTIVQMIKMLPQA